jgi:REP element-mobilizing transposase RayT
MSRPPRPQLPGAIYHVTARGNRRAPIYHDTRDHLIWLDTLADTVREHELKVHAYCMMPNHFHLLLRTVHANLSEGMHMLNANYCQHFNKRHRLTGHVLQGRFHAVQIADEKQLLAVARYICLNPVRAKLVHDPASWGWSSHRHFLNPEDAPEWLETEWLLNQFGTAELTQKIAAYQQFVDAGIGLQSPNKIGKEKPRLVQEKAKPLVTYAARFPDRNEAMFHAHSSGAYTRQEIADHFGVSIRTVSRAIQNFVNQDS